MKAGLRLHLTTFLYITLMVTISALALSYLLISFWIKDGFSLTEMLGIMFFPNVFFLVLTIIVGRVMLLQYVKSCSAQNVVPLKWGYQFLFMALCIVAAVVALDTLIFFAGGSVVSEAFAKALGEFSQSRGENFKTSEIEEFSRLPFFVQNFYNAFFILLGSFIAALWVKLKTAPKKPARVSAHQGVV